MPGERQAGGDARGSGTNDDHHAPGPRRRDPRPRPRSRRAPVDQGRARRAGRCRDGGVDRGARRPAMAGRRTPGGAGAARPSTSPGWRSSTASSSRPRMVGSSSAGAVPGLGSRAALQLPCGRMPSSRSPSRSTRRDGRSGLGPRSSRCPVRPASRSTWSRGAPTRSATRARSPLHCPPAGPSTIVRGAHSLGGSAAQVAALVVARLTTSAIAGRPPVGPAPGE